MWFSREWLETKEKGIGQEWEVSHLHSMQFLVPKPGLEVVKIVFVESSAIFVGLRRRGAEREVWFGCEGLA